MRTMRDTDGVKQKRKTICVVQAVVAVHTHKVAHTRIQENNCKVKNIHTRPLGSSS